MNIVRTHFSETDVVIVGAGAAGLAAARTLHTAKVPYLLLEAQPRIGGRGRTEIADGFPLDLGCGWLHSANRNPWVKIAEERNFTIDHTKPAWERQSCNQGLTTEEQREFKKAMAQFQKAVEKADPHKDRPAASLVDPHDKWTPLLNAVSSYLNGVELGDVSAADLRNYKDSEVNWRLERGYGALIVGYGSSLPVALSCVVEKIDHRAPIIHVETSRGHITAKKIIVTASTNVLASGAIQFSPDLPDKLDSASRLPLGLVNKAFLTCDERLPKDGHFFGDVHTSKTGSYHLRPFGRPIIEAFFAGALARELAREGTEALYRHAEKELVALLGSDIRRRLKPLAASAWHAEPTVRGSYSHAMIGYSNARSRLAQPVDGRIFFAGEACSVSEYSTAHGAYHTGVYAAREAMAASLQTAGGFYTGAHRPGNTH